MALLIKAPARIPEDGSPPKLIDELVGHLVPKRLIVMRCEIG